VVTIKQLIERREKAVADLAEIDEEIATRHGEEDETLDPDPAKAKAAKPAVTTKKA
jgi:hypothetical protein